MKNWLSSFESLGTNCEFGFVQRALDYEESSLLRWAYTDDITALCEAIDSHFAGLFAFENLAPAGGGTMVRDGLVRIAFHTKMLSSQKGEEWEFVLPEATQLQIFKQEQKKIQYLLKKFEHNLAGSDRIYVLKNNGGLSFHDAWRVHDVLAKHGGGRLLCIMVAPSADLVGTVERLNTRLMVGWVDRLAPVDMVHDASVDVWERVLRAAHSAFLAAPDMNTKEKWLHHDGTLPLKDEQRLTERLVSALTIYAPPGQTNPLFDAELYRERYFLATGQRPFTTDNALWHWVEEGRKLHIVPTQFFDEGFYLKTHTYLKETGLFGFEHFLLHGMTAGQSPTKWFNHDEYRSQVNCDEPADYLHFLCFGAQRGIFPSHFMRYLIHSITPETLPTLEMYTYLVEASQKLEIDLQIETYLNLAAIFLAQWHEGEPTSLVLSFLRYLKKDFKYGVSPGPLFNSDIYRMRAITESLPLAGLNENPVLHWLLHGVDARTVPTDRFDEVFYRQHNPDIAAHTAWGFLHFSAHGVYERRRGIQDKKRFSQSHAGLQSDINGLTEQHCLWFEQDFPGRSKALKGVVPNRFNRRLADVLKSDKLRDIFADAQAIDPAVGEIETLTEYLLYPYYDQLAQYHAQLQARLPNISYESVICVPWIRLGGADLVAGLLAHALLRIKPEEKILMIRTDNPHLERSDWLPHNVDVIDASDIFRPLQLPWSQHLLKVLLRGVQAKRVFNVNSHLCWTLFRDQGAFMAANFSTYSYLFCWDHLPSGLRAGYPAEFFVDTIEHLSGCLTDTRYLCDELSRMYHLPPDIQRRLKPLFTPAQSAVRPVAVARQVYNDAPQEAQHRVLWGGRLDRQKRFDLVIDLAQQMPDIEFWCWGSALLDQEPDFSNLPKNIAMQGTFSSFDDLPLTSAGLWLFTALWEGMPTTIIELATRGVGVVASAVGGVPELITPETGWPVAEGATADIYAHVIRQALADPQEVARRAEALQERVGRLYNAQRYDADLLALLNEDKA